MCELKTVKINNTCSEVEEEDIGPDTVVKFTCWDKNRVNNDYMYENLVSCSLPLCSAFLIFYFLLFSLTCSARGEITIPAEALFLDSDDTKGSISFFLTSSLLFHICYYVHLPLFHALSLLILPHSSSSLPLLIPSSSVPIYSSSPPPFLISSSPSSSLPHPLLILTILRS